MSGANRMPRVILPVEPRAPVGRWENGFTESVLGHIRDACRSPEDLGGLRDAR